MKEDKRFYQLLNFWAMMVALWPPNPKELLTTALTSILRAWPGT